MSDLPQNAPGSAREAFAHLNAVTHPTLDDLKLMVFLEAAGETSYLAMAKTAPSAAIAELLEANGKEEMSHAWRVADVIKLLHAIDFAPPLPETNPFADFAGAPVSQALLEALVKGEDNGCTLYQTWAANASNPEAAELFTLNAREEALHGRRAAQALGMLEAASA